MTRKIQNAAISCLKSDGQNERNGVIGALWKLWAYKNANYTRLLSHLLTGTYIVNGIRKNVEIYDSFNSKLTPYFSNGDPIQPGARYKSIHSTLCHSEERTPKNTENPNSFELAVVLTIMMLVGFFMLALALKSACLSSDMSKNYFSSNPNYCPDSSQDQVLGHVE